MAGGRSGQEAPAPGEQLAHWREQAQEAKRELAEFQESSRDLERELENALAEAERRASHCRAEKARVEQENAALKARGAPERRVQACAEASRCAYADGGPRPPQERLVLLGRDVAASEGRCDELQGQVEQSQLRIRDLEQVVRAGGGQPGARFRRRRRLRCGA